MKLNIAERLTLLDALPREGDLTTIKIVRFLRENLSFTEHEHAILQFRAEGNRMQWLQDYGDNAPPPEGMTLDEARAELADLNDGIEFNFGIRATQLIHKTLTDMSNVGKLTEQHISLCEKFEVTE